MGAITSTTRDRNISLEVVSKKGKNTSKGSNSRGRTKRSSVNRPVLQLQIEPATMEKVRHRLASTSGLHHVTRKTLDSLARDSGIYDSLVTRSRTCSNASHNSDHAHHSHAYSMGSHDSLILLEIVKEEHEINGKDMDDSDDDYDHLIPNIEFRHLCDSTYCHISMVGEVEEEEGSECSYGYISLVTNLEEEEESMDEGKRRGEEKDDHDLTLPCKRS